MSANILASFFHEPTTNSSNMDESLILLDDFNLTITSSNITINNSYSDPYSDADNKAFWFLTILPLPLVAVVGNILVILSVYKERSLQTVTNYFIVSLAFADLLVAAVVMPFALYVLVGFVQSMIISFDMQVVKRDCQ
ncbi:hypothetical protein JTE90_024058 [Oedothorax gibbosus]|uniref:G-protein coupled receptors family 1 profile domain-containing protein n=1 Tax=Oedothorax gibbosus TaxID=931172 RepID=A0AAV6TVA7_9ARAC|nr:hypothetical protein JTE90_024058 [Oedothorax gibbosus]